MSLIVESGLEVAVHGDDDDDDDEFEEDAELLKIKN